MFLICTKEAHGLNYQINNNQNPIHSEESVS